MKTAALYACVSTSKNQCRSCDRQFRDGETCPECGSTEIKKGQTPETQLLPLRDYAGRRELGTVIEFVDVGISGSKDRRPALDQLMRDAKLRKFDAVIVARFDRFARSTRHLVLALEEFRSLGVEFISLNESIDTSTPMGKMVFHVLAAVAELERDIIRERVLMGLARARREGKRIGRPRRIVDRDRVLRLYAEHRSVRVSTWISTPFLSLAPMNLSSGIICRR